MAVILQYQGVASYGEFGQFDAYGGGGLAVAHTDYYAAGDRAPRKLAGTHTYASIVLRRGYDPKNDAALESHVQRYRDGIDGGRPVTITVHNHVGAIIATRTYALGKPASIELPGGQAGSNSVGEITLTLEVEQSGF